MSGAPIVGFISPPDWFDPTPQGFLNAVVEPVRVQQAPLVRQGFCWHLDNVKQLQEGMEHNAAALARMGCGLVAQVSSPFTWAGSASESEARARCSDLSRAAGVPVVLNGLAMVDALRAHGVRRVAAHCGYYDPVWQSAFAGFLSLCGFTVVHAASLEELGLEEYASQERGWGMDRELTRLSVLAMVRAAPAAQAVVITGTTTSCHEFHTELEAESGTFVVPGDLALYWAIARDLGLTLKPCMGSLAGLQA